MDKPQVITSRAVEMISPEAVITQGESGPQDHDTLGNDPERYDELTIMAWAISKFAPYAAEYFKVSADESETRKQLLAVDSWVRDQLEAEGKKPTIYNFKQLMKQLNSEHGVRTLEDFNSKILSGPKEPSTIGDKLGNNSAFADLLRSVAKVIEPNDQL